MGYDFTTDERYQTDHSVSPVIEAKDKRIAELEEQLAKIHASADRRSFAIEWYFGGVRMRPGDYVLMRVGPVTSDETPF